MGDRLKKMYQQQITSVMFNLAINKLVFELSEQCPYKVHANLIKRCLNLTIPIKASYTKERIFFTVAQTIITLIAQAIKIDNQLAQTQNQLKQEHDIYEGLQMITPKTNCPRGYLNVALVIFKYFCPKFETDKIISLLIELKLDIEKHDFVLEEVLPRRPFQYPINLHQEFQCHCSYFLSDQEFSLQKSFIVCPQCHENFHPKCQSTNLYCNACFLRFCLAELNPRDPFGKCRKTNVYFFGYLHPLTEEAEEVQENQNEKKISFGVIRFDVAEKVEIDEKRDVYTVELRIALARQIFPSKQSKVRIKKKGKGKKNMESCEIEGIQYEFYLNQNLLNISLISKNCYLAKVHSRLLQVKDNLLLIKSSSSKINQNIEKEDATLMIGIYKITKIKPSLKKLYFLPENQLGQISTQKLISSQQSQLFVKNSFQNIKEKTISVSLINKFNQKPIVDPVRSYSCSHIQCLDYSYFKDIFKKEKGQTKHKKKLFAQKPKYPLLLPEDFIQDAQNGEKRNFQEELNLQNENNSELIPVDLEEEFEKKRQKRLKRNKGKCKRECPICERTLLTLYQDPFMKKILDSASKSDREAAISSHSNFWFNSGHQIIIDS